MSLTLYWHDYETFGIDPRRDRPAQFAGLRTDTDFNIIGDPLVVYCQLPLDSLPHPDACLITGITPQLTQQKGVCEAEFIARIQQELGEPNTCTLGYNNLRFDDEVTRNCLYRNFYDPYAREWQNGNSRWDLLDVIRAARALRPEGINWPVDIDGKPTLRLDHLTIANGISHESAHDALDDVYATLAIAKRLKAAQSKLFTFLFEHRGKHQATELLAFGTNKAVVHVSGKYPTSQNNLAIVLPVAKHPTNNNGIIVYDLSVDPEALLSLSVAEIQQRIFTATVDLPEHVERIPLKTVRVNKCPVLAPLAVIRATDEERLGINLAQSEQHRQQIISSKDLSAKIAAVFADKSGLIEDTDPDLMIYSGGFFSHRDKQTMEKIRQLDPKQLGNTTFNFDDSRLGEMLFRYRARNYPTSLTTEEDQQWREFCHDRLHGKEQGAWLTFNDYFARLDELSKEQIDKADLIGALIAYAEDKMQSLN